MKIYNHNFLSDQIFIVFFKILLDSRKNRFMEKIYKMWEL